MFELLIPVLGKLFDRLIPDQDKANEAKAELLKMQLSGELQQIMGQLEINKQEAASTSLFVAGWRPWVGWVCGVAMCYAAVLEPIMRFVAVVCFAYNGGFPVIDTSLTLQILGGLLGLGALRSWDKKNGVAS